MLVTISLGQIFQSHNAPDTFCIGTNIMQLDIELMNVWQLLTLEFFGQIF